MKTKTLCYFSQKDIIHDSQLMEIMLKCCFRKHIPYIKQSIRDKQRKAGIEVY